MKTNPAIHVTQETTLEDRLRVHFDDRLEGRIDTGTHDREASQIRDELAEVQRLIEAGVRRTSPMSMLVYGFRNLRKRHTSVSLGGLHAKEANCTRVLFRTRWGRTAS